MTTISFTGLGERGARMLASLLQFMNNAGMIDIVSAADGEYYINTSENDVLRVGYTDLDSQVIAEVEAVTQGDLQTLLQHTRVVAPEGGAGMDRKEGRALLKNHEDVANFIFDLLENGDGNIEVVKIFMSAYGGTGSGFADGVLDKIKEGGIPGLQGAESPAIIVDVALPELKRDNQPIRVEDGELVFRYPDTVDQVAEFEAAAANDVISAIAASDNGLALIAEMMHQGHLTLDQLRSIVKPVLEENNWSAVADYLRTQLDLDEGPRVGHLNTSALRTQSGMAMLRFDDRVTFREPAGGHRDRTDMTGIAEHNTVIVNAHARVNGEQATNDEAHLGQTTSDAVIAATKRAANMPLAAVSPRDVNMAQVLVATADDTPLNHLDTARNALAQEFGNGDSDYHITSTAVTGTGPEHFVDGEQRDAAVWLRFGADTVLPAYEAVEAQF
jgi:hypothetical protein